MHPVLFTIFDITIDTYSVIWFIALSLAIVWCIRRLDLYGLDEYESRRVMSVSFFCMLLGALIFKQLRNIGKIIMNPSLLLGFKSWGLSEFGAVMGAFISAFVMCMISRKVSFLKLCDAATPPGMLAIAVGRWGCFLHGCCVGLPSKFFMAVHFPFDRAGVFRHPVQIYYSVISAVIVMILLYVEKKIIPLQKNSKTHYSVIAPLGMILYALMRFAIAPFREWRSLTQIIMHWNRPNTYFSLAIVFPILCVWLIYSLIKLKSVSQDK